MKKQLMVTTVLLVLALGGLLGGRYVYYVHIKPPYKPTLDAVAIAPVALGDWRPRLDVIGTLRAEKELTISPEVAGIVEAILFKSGQRIEKGAPVLQLDSRVLSATYERDQAKLAVATLNHKRNLAIYRQKALSASALDKSHAELKQAQAISQETKAKLQRRTLTAPFSGKLGLRQVNVGQYLEPGQAVVHLRKTDTLLVDFSIPERYLPEISTKTKAFFTTPTYPGEKRDISIFAVEAGVAPTMRNLPMRAKVANTDGQLLPGMFVRVSVLLPVQKNVAIVPQSAIRYSLHGDTVYVVKKDIAEMRQVTLGERRGDKVVVLEGLKAGEQLVIDGSDKLYDGEKVNIVAKRKNKI